MGTQSDNFLLRISSPDQNNALLVCKYIFRAIFSSYGEEKKNQAISATCLRQCSLITFLSMGIHFYMGCKQTTKETKGAKETQRNQRRPKEVQ